MTQQLIAGWWASDDNSDMWVPAIGFELRWYTWRQGPEVCKELQFRQVLSHSQGWESPKWSDWKAVPIVSEVGIVRPEPPSGRIVNEDQRPPRPSSGADVGG